MKNDIAEKKITLGSLFDGIGGFPLAAIYLGIIPVWASEIEVAPISITKRHFPQMKHLGDIKKINGYEIKPVDIITFGSPCQDLSLAGKRTGLKGERSGLFIEAIRIIKEMRNATHGKYPTFAVWENVTGAFSSNGGGDFRIVLQEISSIAENGVSIPKPSAETDGGLVWKSAGSIMGNNFSLAWRILDAQYWGVPQRRKRIFLVADFRGQRAAEILFKPDSLQGNSSESGKARKGTAGDIASGFGETGIGYWQNGIQCLRAEGENRPSRPSNVIVEKAIGVDSYNQNLIGRKMKTLRYGRSDGDNIGIVLEKKTYPEKVVGSLIARSDGSPCVDRGQPFICQQYSVDFGRTADRIQMNPSKAVTLLGEGGGGGAKTGLYCLPIEKEIQKDDVVCLASSSPNAEITENDISPTILARAGTGGNQMPLICTSVHQNQCGEVRMGEVANTLNTNGNATGRNAPTILVNDYKESNVITVEKNNTTDSHEVAYSSYAVRRLTPEECERLQGFPDEWTKHGHEGKKISDSARYKALGNSVAIPCVIRVLRGITESYNEHQD